MLFTQATCLLYCMILSNIKHSAIVSWFVVYSCTGHTEGSQLVRDESGKVSVVLIVVSLRNNKNRNIGQMKDC